MMHRLIHRTLQRARTNPSGTVASGICVVFLSSLALWVEAAVDPAVVANGVINPAAPAEATAPRSDRSWVRPISSEFPMAFDYHDPVYGGLVPLTPVRGYRDRYLSEHFRVGDFAARDGAAWARISPRLVAALESLQAHFDVPVHVLSGYRHPARNADPLVDGADESRHMAGLAADVWVDDLKPLDLATVALDVLGCEIGIGLGQHALHVDVRGHLASWVREGAALAEADFDLWVLERCDPELARTMIEATPDSGDAEPAFDLETYRREMTAVARLQQRRMRRGVVLLDLRRDVPGRDSNVDHRLSYVSPGDPLLLPLGLDPLMERAEYAGNFVYLLIAPDGSQEVGVMQIGP